MDQTLAWAEPLNEIGFSFGVIKSSNGERKMSYRITLLSLASLALAACQTTSGKPVACANSVKQALTKSTWELTTEFTNSDGTQSYTVGTNVSADGTMTIGPSLKITCSSRKIAFDWRHDPSKRYTLTLEKDGVFSGSRTGSRSDYNATLKRI